MVWGAISVHGVSLLHIVEGTMCQDQYQQVLATRLLPQIREWFRDAADAVIFQQDSAPCHAAKKVKEFIQQQELKPGLYINAEVRRSAAGQSAVAFGS